MVVSVLVLVLVLVSVLVFFSADCFRASWLMSSKEMSEMVRWRVSIESLGGFWLLVLVLVLFFMKFWRNVVSLFGAIEE